MSIFRKPVRLPAVTIAGWILFLGALLNLLFGFLFIYASGFMTQHQGSVVILEVQDKQQALTPEGADIVKGTVDILLGIVQVVFTIGFFRMQRWAWVGAMSWQALKLLFEIASVFLGGGTLITILFASLLVFLLNQADVRRTFRIQPENESSSSPPVRILDSN